MCYDQNRKYENEVSIEFQSKSSNEAFARVCVAAFISQLDPTVSDISDIKTAVSEAVTNSIIHGYKDKQGIVKLLCGYKENVVYIKITDNGSGIENIEQAMQPLYTSKPELERSGMGFTVMETFMDHVEVKSTLDEGTTIYMTKQIRNISI